MMKNTDSYNNLKRLSMINLRDSVDKLGMRQSELAKLLGVSQPRVSDLMTGKIDLFSLDSIMRMQTAIDDVVAKDA